MGIEDLREIFISAQDSQNQHQLVKAFKKLYKEVAFEEFWPKFQYLVKHPIRIYEREAAVEKTIDFISKAVTELALDHEKTKTANKENEDEEDLDDDMHPLLLNFFEFLLDVHSCKEQGVRFRVCQLVTKLLSNLGEGAKIDDSLYDRIYVCMRDRLKDKSPTVRVHAVLALTRLQDPQDPDCQITKAYIILMTRDPNVEVRRIILTTISPSRHCLAAIIERTRDVKDTVRKTAFNVIAEKIPLRALTIEQRVKLLHDGLNDRSELVKTTCAKKLLQAWLVASEGNILDLLTRLDVQSSVKTCDMMLSILFKDAAIFDLVEQFTILDEKSLIPEDKLTCESAFYWRNIVQYIQKSGTDFDEQLDKVKPNCLEFCGFLESVTKKLVDCQDLDAMLDIEFVIQQLLEILLCMDLSDIASRNRVEALLSSLLLSDHVGSSLVDHILPCLAQLYPQPDALVGKLAEVISEIREPISSVEKEMSHSDRRDLDKKIAGIRVTLNELKEELGGCIENQDFERAAELKQKICSLDAERSSLLDESTPKPEEVRIQRDDPLTMLKCLTIVCELLTYPTIKTLTPTLHMLMETQALPGMTNEEAEVRNAAVKAIGLCCLIKRDLVMQHLPLMLQASQMDTELVRTSAMKCIFDIVHVYGLEAFSDDAGVSASQETTDASLSVAGSEADQGDGDESADVINSTVDQTVTEQTTQQVTTTDRTGWSETASKIVAIMSKYLDDESTEIRTVSCEGLCKLLLSGRVVSPKLLSHLLLLWYNPTVEDDNHLVQCLGTFFPLFAFSSSHHQQLVEEAFLPTLKTLLKAPSTSPLSDVNEFAVASYMLELVNAPFLLCHQRSQTNVMENPCHDSLAIKLCNEILSKPDSFNVKLWLRVLNQLSLSQDNITACKDLMTMCEDIAIIVTEKQCVKLLEKFRENVSYLHDTELGKTTAANNTSVASGSAANKSLASQSGSEAGSEDMSGNLSVLSANSGSTSTVGSKTPAPKRSTRGSKAKATKTPAVPKSAKKSNLKSAKKADNSEGDDSVFTTPAPPRVARVDTELERTVERTRMNLANMFVDDEEEEDVNTPEVLKNPSKAPKTPKRPLHTIQDPTFTG